MSQPNTEDILESFVKELFPQIQYIDTSLPAFETAEQKIQQLYILKSQAYEYYAIQQLTGYQMGWFKEPLSSLIDSMGLTSDEWLKIEPECQWLDKGLIDEIRAKLGLTNRKDQDDQ